MSIDVSNINSLITAKAQKTFHHAHHDLDLTLADLEVVFVVDVHPL